MTPAELSHFASVRRRNAPIHRPEQSPFHASARVHTMRTARCSSQPSIGMVQRLLSCKNWKLGMLLSLVLAGNVAQVMGQEGLEADAGAETAVVDEELQDDSSLQADDEADASGPLPEERDNDALEKDAGEVVGADTSRQQGPAAEGDPVAGDAAKVLDATAVEDTIQNILRNTDEITVQAALLGGASEPARLMKALDVLSTVGQEETALELVKAQLRQGLSGNSLQEAAAATSAKLLIALENRPALQPEGRELAKLLAEAKSAQRDGAWWEQQALRILRSKTGAVERLAELGPSVIPALVTIASDSAYSESALAQQALNRLAVHEYEACLAFTEGANEKETLAIIQALQSARPKGAIERLAAWMVSSKSSEKIRDAAAQTMMVLHGKGVDRAAVEDFLTYRFEKLRQRLQLNALRLANQVVWLREGDMLVRREIPQDIQTLKQLVTVCEALASAKQESQAPTASVDGQAAADWQLMASLEVMDYLALTSQAASPSSQESPLSAVEAGELARLLDAAMDAQLMGASYALATKLQTAGDASLLPTSPGKPSAMARACMAPDRRVRLAAARAIVHWKPEQTYNGRELLRPTLEYFSAAEGKRTVAAYLPGAFGTRSLNRFLAPAGWSVADVQSLHELRDEVFNNPDVELILCDAGLWRADFRALLDELRSDCRSAGIPIVISCRAEQVDSYRTLAKQYGRCGTWVQVTDDVGAKQLLREASSLVHYRDVTAAYRMKQKEEAAELLRLLDAAAEKEVEEARQLPARAPRFSTKEPIHGGRKNSIR